MLWLGDWWFCQELDCLDREPAPVLRDRFFAQWLQESKEDASRMVAMRTLLSQEHNAWQISSMSDEAVIDQIAELLISGLLHVHVEPEQAVSGTSSGASEEKVAPFPLSERKPRPAVDRAPVNDPPTFSDIDGAAQADTLVAAAAGGKPFCPE